MNNRTLSLLVSVGAFLSVASLAQADITFTWQTTGVNALYRADGTQYDVGDLYFQLVVDPDLSAPTTTTDFSQFTPLTPGIGLTDPENGIWDVNSTASDDTAGVWDAGSWLYIPGTGHGMALPVTSFIDDAYQQDAFYFRWFNASDIGSATEVGYIWNPTWVLPDAGQTGGANPQFGDGDNTGTMFTGAAGPGWQTVAAVPEPGSMGLLALGLVTLVARKRKRA